MALQEREVKAHIVPDDGIIAAEVCHFLEYIVQGGGVAHHLIGDAGELGDEGGDGFAGVDERAPLIFHAVPVKTDSSNFQDGILCGIQACCFDIDGNHLGHGEIITCGVWRSAVWR